MLMLETKSMEPVIRSSVNLFSYVKHAVIGAMVAVMSFGTALAFQPKISDSGMADMKPFTVYEATEADLRVLMPYMGDIEGMDGTPAEIIITCSQENEEFAAIVEDYFN